MSQIKLPNLFLASCLLFLQNCVDQEVFEAVPEMAERPGDATQWPTLVPSSEFDTLRANNSEVAETSEAEALRLAARVERLRAKAARLKGPVLSSRERAELQGALANQ